jgi:hypothetical protein
VTLTDGFTEGFAEGLGDFRESLKFKSEATLLRPVVTLFRMIYNGRQKNSQEIQGDPEDATIDQVGEGTNVHAGSLECLLRQIGGMVSTIPRKTNIHER